MRTWNLRAALLLAIYVLFGFAACSSDPPDDNPGSAVCGDSARNGDEVCDGKDLRDTTCESLGFGPGELACATNCRDFDRSACGAPSTCGNGAKDGVEICDGADIGGKSCVDLGYGEGTLGCTANCGDFNVNGCGAPESCGNGKKDGIETCDDADLGGATCESLGNDGGTLSCSIDCLSFDTAGCECTPSCGGLECGPDPKCGLPCGTCDGFSACEAGVCVTTCDFAPITADTTLDIDLKTVTLSGKVTLNGAPMPDDMFTNGQPRGYLLLTDKVTGDTVYHSLGETGPSSYSFQVFAGVYDVYVESDDDYDQTVLPNSQTTLIMKDLSLMASATKDIDLKMVTLSGKVTLNGAPMPDDMFTNGQPRGYILLTDTTTNDTLYYGIGETGPANYSFKTFAGVFDMYVESDDDYDQTVLPNSQTTLIAKAVSVMAPTTKDIDLKMVTLSGKVTLNGAAMPDDMFTNGQPRGYILLTDTTTNDTLYYGIGETGPANYSFKTFAGVFDMYVESDDDYDQTVLPNSQTTLIAKAVSVMASTTKDIDLKMVTLSGKVTLNGAVMPDDMFTNGQPRGYILLTDMTTNDTLYYGIGETGPANYSFKTFAGVFDMYVESDDDYDQTVLPNSQTTLIAKAVSVMASTTKDIDLKMVTLSGKVTLNGAAMPDDMFTNGQPRGYILLTDTTTNDTLYYGIGETGPANYSFKTFAGVFDMYMESDDDYDQTVLPNSQTTLITKGVSVMASTTKDIDLKMVTLSGKVTLNGAAMPDDMFTNGQPRGYILLTDVVTRDTLYYGLGETGPANYSFKTFAGAFDIFIESDDDYDQTVLPNAQTVRIRKGCSN